MVRSRMSVFKHLFGALWALVFLVCASEFGLRIHAWRAGGANRPDAKNPELTTDCWMAHHRLKPLQTLRIPNHDSDKPVLVRTNSFGLRGPEIAVPKPPGVYRVICLGDERTLAVAVEEQETFCARLEALLQQHTRLRVEVVNAGVPEYCPLLSYLQMKHTLIALQADLYLLNFDMSDVADDHRFRRHTHVNDDGSPLDCSSAVTLASSTSPLERLDEQFLLVKWARTQTGLLPAGDVRPEDLQDIDAPQGRYAWIKDNPPDWDVYIEQAFSPIAQMQNLANGIYARFIVAVAPAPWQVSPQATAASSVRKHWGIGPDIQYKSRRPFELLGSYADAHSIPLFDASAALAQFDQPERAFLDHSPEFSPLGHEWYARQLAQFIFKTVPGLWNDGTSRTRARNAISNRRTDEHTR